MRTNTATQDDARRARGGPRPAHSLPASAVVALALVGAACGAPADDPDPVAELAADIEVDPDADTTPNDDIELLTAGDPSDRIELTGRLEAGDAGTTEVSTEIRISVDGMGQTIDTGFDLDMEFEQQVVEDDGGLRTRFTVTDAAMEDLGDEIGASALEDTSASVDEVIGIAFVADIGIDGVPSGAWEPSDGQPVPELITEANSAPSPTIVVPTEPVGVGAVWTTTHEMDVSGVVVETTALYELVDLGPDEFVIVVSESAQIDDDIDGVEARGVISADGRLTVSRSNPLEVEQTYDSTTSMSTSADGEEMEMTMRVSMSVEGR